MRNYDILKNEIEAVIKANGVKAITGNVLQGVLVDMVDALGDGYAIEGLATTTTNPPAPVGGGKVAYIAASAGTYTYFLDANANPLVVPSNCLTALLMYDPSVEAWECKPFGTVAAGTIGTAELADGAVTTPKLASGAVTTAKLATGAVTNAKMGAGAVSEDKLATAVQNKINNAVTLTGDQYIRGTKEFDNAVHAAGFRALDDAETLPIYNIDGNIQLMADEVDVIGDKLSVDGDIEATGTIYTNSEEVATKNYVDGVDSGKADRVSGATNGNFAGLDASGNLKDSGKKAADFATAAQGAKADTSYQKPASGIPESDLSSAVQTSLGKADQLDAINPEYKAQAMLVGYPTDKGYYYDQSASNKSNAKISSSSFNSLTVAVTQGDEFLATATLGGGAMAMAIYYKANGDKVGIQYRGDSMEKIDVKLTVPALATEMVFTFRNDKSASLYKISTDVGRKLNELSRSINVLLLGSSHGRDTIGQFPILANSAGVDVIVGNYFYGSLSLSQLASYCNDNINLPGGEYKKYSHGSGWVWQTRTNLKAILQAERWDYISIQRSASEDETWTAQQAADLETIMDYITAKCSNAPHIVFNSGFADASNHAAHTPIIWETAQKVREQYGIDIIPMAPVLEICRQDPTLAALGTYTGTPPNLTCDGQHLDRGVGMYVSGCVCMSFFLRHLGKNCFASQYLPVIADVQAVGGSASTFTPITMPVAKLIRGYVTNYFNEHVGSINDLKTDAKESVVAAINEIDAHTDDNAADIAAVAGSVAGAVSDSSLALNIACAASPYVIFREKDGTFRTISATVNANYFKTNYPNVEEVYSLGATFNQNSSTFKDCAFFKKIHSKLARIFGWAGIQDYFRNSGITEFEGSADTVVLSNATSCFYNCTSLTKIGDLTNYAVKETLNMSQMFYMCSALVTIEGLINIPVAPSSISNTFGGCSSLANINKVGLILSSINLSSSPLTATSVLNVLNGLSADPEWVAGNTYAKYDRVIYQGVRYYCNTANSDASWTAGNWVAINSVATFKSGIYANFTAEEKADIDAAVVTATSNGWSIVNMS